jgi:hypothetical protein
LFLRYPASGQNEFKKSSEKSKAFINKKKYSMCRTLSLTRNKNDGISQEHRKITYSLINTERFSPHLEVEPTNGVRKVSSMVALDTTV